MNTTKSITNQSVTTQTANDTNQLNANLNMRSTSSKLTSTQSSGYELPKTDTGDSLTNGIYKLLFKSLAPKRSLEASIDSQGKTVVKTEDGYSITFLGENQAWIITSPTGHETRVWGDPHVSESDGDTWDFTKQSSFEFGNNKISVETVKKANGGWYSQTVSIYNNGDYVGVSGIDNDKPKLTDWKYDEGAHDKNLDDGENYILELNGKNGQWVGVP